MGVSFSFMTTFQQRFRISTPRRLSFAVQKLRRAPHQAAAVDREIRVGRGRGGAQVSAEPYVVRSRSREHTFQRDLEDWDQVRAELVALARQVTEDVVADGRPAVRVVVKVRYKPFFTSTHGQGLSEPTQDEAAIAAAALAALEMFTNRRPVRLLGVRAELERPGG
jgi:DNA polymerase-4